MDLFQCPNFRKKFLAMLYYVFDLLSSWKWQNWMWFKLWVLWKMRELFQSWASWRQDYGIVYVNIWIWCVGCLHNLFIPSIPLPSQLGLMRARRCLLAWCVLASMPLGKIFLPSFSFYLYAWTNVWLVS